MEQMRRPPVVNPATRNWKRRPPQDWDEVVQMMFMLGKTFAGKRFPAGPQEKDARFAFYSQWADEVADIGLPPALWYEAVMWFCQNQAAGDMWDLGAARRAAFHVRDQWDASGDAARQRMLGASRRARLQRRVDAGELPPSVVPPETSELDAGVSRGALAASQNFQRALGVGEERGGLSDARVRARRAKAGFAARAAARRASESVELSPGLPPLEEWKETWEKEKGS